MVEERDGGREAMARRLKEMIVFENEHVIVISKDNGVPSQMGTGLSVDNKGEVSIDRMLEAYCKLNPE
jgi:23S rRNA-/tRNA-specific pseudouridylate synthase